MTIQTAFRLEEALLATLKQLSKDDGRSMTWHVNKALNAYLVKDEKKPKPKKERFDPVEFGSRYDKLHQPAWLAWCEKRKDMKKPISKTAATSQINMLVEHDLEAQRKIVWQSIQNDYQGLFTLKEDKTNGQPRKSLSERSAAKTTKLLANCEDVGDLLGSDDPFIRPQVGFKGG